MHHAVLMLVLQLYFAFGLSTPDFVDFSGLHPSYIERPVAQTHACACHRISFKAEGVLLALVDVHITSDSFACAMSVERAAGDRKRRNRSMRAAEPRRGAGAGMGAGAGAGRGGMGNREQRGEQERGGRQSPEHEARERVWV